MFFALALVNSLFVQTLASPLAGSWLFFFLCGCVLLVWNHKYKPAGMLWYACVAWAFTIGASAFIVHPVFKAAATMWVLLAMPILALVLDTDSLKRYIAIAGAVIAVYSAGLILQMVFHVQFIPGMDAGRYGWPLLDPNNGAAVINCALLPSVWLSLKNKKWLLLTAFYAAALYATGSKTGLAVAATGTIIFLASAYGEKVILGALVAFSIGLAAIFVWFPSFVVLCVNAVTVRFTIWWCSWIVLKENIWRGTGIGTYGMFRIRQGFELYIPPTYAHNDILQFAVEMGIPATLIFCFLMLAVLFKKNLVSCATIMAILIQAMMEFQFYIPSVSLLMGVALAYHMKGAPYVIKRRSIL